MRHKRIGKFRISIDMIEKDINVVQKIMCECVPIRAESLYASNCIEYIAISNHFNKIKPGVVIPEYIVEIDTIDNKVINIRFEKV